MRSRQVLLALAAVLILVGAGAGRNVGDWLRRQQDAAHWNARTDQHLPGLFSAVETVSSDPAAERPYRHLFAYFVTGYLHYASADGATARLPGQPGRHGAKRDGLRAFARTAPMVAAWLASGRPAEIRDLTGLPVRLDAFLQNAILAGTHPKSPSYWGEIVDFDPAIDDAAGIAVTLWLLRDRLWARLPEGERDQIAAWLGQVGGLEVADDKAHLAPVLVNAVLAELGYADRPEEVPAHWQRFKSFYRGEGWFSDGPGEVFDFANAWDIQYQLFWLDLIAPGLDHDFIAATQIRFAEDYSHLISPLGLPILGRDVCNRLAAPVPLIAAAMRQGGPAPGLARRSLDAVWENFLKRGAVAEGVVTQGYCGADPGAAGNGGPADCLASLRSLTLAFLNPPQSAFWQAPPEPLPIERGSFRLALPSPGWIVVGDAADGDIRIQRLALMTESEVPPAPQPWEAAYSKLLTVAEIAFGRALRDPPDGFSQIAFSARHPFCGCVEKLTAPPMLEASAQ
ncbi:DUF2264 domain-containing protein [Telmatospirillum sp. J64-1]|uniref:DUF2264 domain-containing protein n=1 Tax=Telmatospirillum sp. J64-1 TaxID=2502183 RepID=UPI00115E01E4|nr:DUF2264 domain-containing protein [Telmatospirillum sp. J64-1]